MKRIIAIIAAVVLAAGIVAPAARAEVVGALDYSVSTTNVGLTAAGVGSFAVTVPAAAAYGSVEFVVRMPDGAVIDSVGYSLTEANKIGPTSRPSEKDILYFSCYSTEGNIYTEPLTCTINVKYAGSAQTTLVVKEIRQTRIISSGLAVKNEDLLSNKETVINLIPYSVDKPGPPNSSNNTGASPGSGSGVVPTGGQTAEIMDTVTPLAAQPFADVREGDWFYGDVVYMWGNRLMNGTSGDQFSPNSTLTRGMAVTVLYRIENMPAITEPNASFLDVAVGQYYTDAVTWAVNKGIVLGYGDGNFGPNDNVTREQLATLIYRYQRLTGNVPPDTKSEAVFSDGASISDYAREAVGKLVLQGIVYGKPDNLFVPKGSATRAEFAAMLHRLLETAKS
ncbi:MAG: S-layer homology domain-containing protein [Clostridiales Family XIII bacterium]|jgi:hypothetical protein|nr:S-layer homology domain-containing protein [Clostridiales Family XIII bacterium]